MNRTPRGNFKNRPQKYRTKAVLFRETKTDGRDENGVPVVQEDTNLHFHGLIKFPQGSSNKDIKVFRKSLVSHAKKLDIKCHKYGDAEGFSMIREMNNKSDKENCIKYATKQAHYPRISKENSWKLAIGSNTATEKFAIDSILGIPCDDRMFNEHAASFFGLHLTKSPWSEGHDAGDSYVFQRETQRNFKRLSFEKQSQPNKRINMKHDQNESSRRDVTRNHGELRWNH